MKEDYVPMKYSTSSSFPPSVMQKGHAIDEIIKNVLKHEMYPPSGLKADRKCADFTKRLREFTQNKGYFLISRSLVRTCNLGRCTVPFLKSVVCDAFLVTESHPPTVLTFTLDSPKQNPDIPEYNKSVATGLTYARYFTKEHFDIMYGVVTSEDIKSVKTFTTLLHDVEKATSIYCIPSNLVMSENKCKEIYKAVITCSALTELTDTKEMKEKDSSSTCQYVLSAERYTTLMEYLNIIPCDGRIPRVPDDEYLKSVLNERVSRTSLGTVKNENSEKITPEKESVDTVFEGGQTRRKVGSCVKHKSEDLNKTKRKRGVYKPRRLPCLRPLKYRRPTRTLMACVWLNQGDG